MRIYHLLKTANAEVESDFLKPTRKVEKKTHLWVLVGQQWYLLSGSVGAGDFIACKTLLKIFVKYPSFLSPYDAFYAVQ